MALVSIALPLALSLIGMSSSVSPTDPYVIYDRARETWQKQQYPAIFQYRTTIRVSEGAKDEREHFRCESMNGDVRAVGVSEEEQDAPHETSGTNFKLRLTIGWNVGSGGQRTTADADASRKEASPDYLGVPLISPAYSFGLDPTFADSNPEGQSSYAGVKQPLTTITTVKAIDRPYSISLVGAEYVGALYAYHLHLEPLRKPDVYRIRDLWIDAYTYQVLKLELQGDFTNSPMKDVPWMVTFQNVDGLTYIDSETTESSLTFRRDRVFTSASITFDQIESGSSTQPVLPNVSEAPALREP